ncbi:hypothetical protein AB0J83_47820 [Actinoplanes sp. NPDC049596]|uniref:hypothetical protein n=1 Tax=unclassified Actinoplanes TaxID=2626549 RepID=UPI003428AFA3
MDDSSPQDRLRSEIERTQQTLRRLAETEDRVVEVEERVAATNDHLAATRGDVRYHDRADHARRQAQQARKVASAIRQGDAPDQRDPGDY